jgi:hypothetical protein
MTEKMRMMRQGGVIMPVEVWRVDTLLQGGWVFVDDNGQDIPEVKASKAPEKGKRAKTSEEPDEVEETEEAPEKEGE